MKFEERAAIKQFDAELPKEQSEKEALEEMIELCISRKLKNEYGNNKKDASTVCFVDDTEIWTS